MRILFFCIARSRDFSILQNFWYHSHACYVNQITFKWDPWYAISAKWGYRVIRNVSPHIVHHIASAIKHYTLQKISYLATDMFKLNLFEWAIRVIWQIRQYANRIIFISCFIAKYSFDTFFQTFLFSKCYATPHLTQAWIAVKLITETMKCAALLNY